MSTYGFVYLFKSGDIYKIGRSKNPKKRVESFTSYPFLVEIICVLKTYCMQKLEQQMHKKYETKRLRGEWFRLTSNDVEEFLNHPLRQP